MVLTPAIIPMAITGVAIIGVVIAAPLIIVAAVILEVAIHMAARLLTEGASLTEAEAIPVAATLAADTADTTRIRKTVL